MSVRRSPTSIASVDANAVVSELSDLLDRARAGQLKGFAWVTLDADRDYTMGAAGLMQRNAETGCYAADLLKAALFYRKI